MPFDEDPEDEEPDPLLFKSAEGLALSIIGVNLARTSSIIEAGTRSSLLLPRRRDRSRGAVHTNASGADADRDHSHHASRPEPARKPAILLRSTGGEIVPVVRKMVTFCLKDGLKMDTAS